MPETNDHSPSQKAVLSPRIVEHATRPRNLGKLNQPDGLGAYTHGCGDSITVHIDIKNNRIEKIRYLPQSCVTTLACISMASTMVEGLSPVDARRAIQSEAISEALGGLPQSELHCAEIAARAIWAAIDDYLLNHREPWKKLYR